MNKVWYRNGDQLDVDVIADRTAALRRAASMVSAKAGSDLHFVGIEDDQGQMLSLGDFDDYVKGYRLRGLADEPAICPKYYVEVRAPESVQKSAADEWVRYAIETTRVRADRRAIEAETTFGPRRVRVVPVVAQSEVARV